MRMLFRTICNIWFIIACLLNKLHFLNIDLSYVSPIRDPWYLHLHLHWWLIRLMRTNLVHLSPAWLVLISEVLLHNILKHALSGWHYSWRILSSWWSRKVISLFWTWRPYWNLIWVHYYVICRVWVICFNWGTRNTPSSIQSCHWLVSWRLCNVQGCLVILLVEKSMWVRSLLNIHCSGFFLWVY